MLLLDDGAIAYSASDLAEAASCEFAVLRTLDAKLGRIAPFELAADAMLERAARLGDAHELRVLQGYRERFGPWDRDAGTGVVEIERPAPGLHHDRATLAAKHRETIAALRTGADVVFQGGFFDGRFSGWADFLVREPGSGLFAVYDSKLARHAKVTALLQVTAYADQLIAAGLTPAPTVHLILGDQTVTDHALVDLLPVYRDRRARLQSLLDSHHDATAPIAWEDERYPEIRACLRCEVCTAELEARRDVLLVAGLRVTQRARLRAAGIASMDELAASVGQVGGIAHQVLDRLRAQARLQSRQHPPEPDEGRAAAGADHADVEFELFAPEVVGSLPRPDPGDLFFDFEGDPLWTDDAPSGDPADWGLEYLFGVVEAPSSTAPPVFRPFWAHDRAAEKQALVDFLELVRERRAAYPGMHVYHYAPYEKTALLRLAGRHGVGEAAVDALLRDGVLVDLYATVRGALRTGQPSYSLKKLEPLYMDAAREGEVTTAGDSIVEYAQACAVRDAGDDAQWRRRLATIADYNEYDCVSTLRLRDWLLARAAEAGVLPKGGRVHGSTSSLEDAAAPEADPLVESLLAHAERMALTASLGDDAQAVRLLAASLGYHWRESKPFWWGHFDRLLSDPSEWTERRSTFLVEEAGVIEPWHMPPFARTLRRRLRLVGQLEAGSELSAGTPSFAIYDPPFPQHAKSSESGTRAWTEAATVVSVGREDVGGSGLPARDVVVVDDRLPATAATHDWLPMAIGPGQPPSTKGLADAIRLLATSVDAGLPSLPGQPAIDVLRRVAPRARDGVPLPKVGATSDGYITAITGAVLNLDHSYLAVQGPPGTGKTYAGARVIARLVAKGWHVGVVAQSHAVVENMLEAIAEAGVDAAAIAKKPSGSAARRAAPWTWVDSDPAWRQFYAAQPAGYVVGGTAWDFTNAKRLPGAPLDLLVIDEAGQFALASTVAVSGAARNLLLLGDPQQLPQVSQGVHPEPVDRSALAWLTDGHETLPPELGYFLAKTWRMHPALCAPVSRLAYEGRLAPEPCTWERSLEGVAPGIRTVALRHHGNAVTSREEAVQVVAEVRAMLGHRWVDPSRHQPSAAVDAPLAQTDVIVVAAYNAQVWTVREALDSAGLTDVRVGTVDKFQGQQAAVVLVTLAASSPDDVPRGMEFLLNRNRINVAVSRGKWSAVIVRSERLTGYLPTTPAGLADLGAFLGLDD